ncbi:MAG TPA: hypothetical protein VGF91_10910 [Solirubrobacteraceae bacterium]|jgi:hypothetical protein
MKRNRKRVLVAVLAICALAAGGAAFTASITGTPTNVVSGFAQTTVNGAQATGFHWTLSQDNQFVTSAALTLGADGTNGTTVGAALPATDVVKAGFNVGPSQAIDWATCTTTDQQNYTCDLDTTANTSGAPVTGATIFDVSVTDPQYN